MKQQPNLSLNTLKQAHRCYQYIRKMQQRGFLKERIRVHLRQSDYQDTEIKLALKWSNL